MNWDQVEGHWQEIKGTIRQKWAKLTDSDIEAIGGKKDQLVGVLKQRYGYERDKASTEVDGWMDSIADKIAGRDKPPLSH